MIVVLGLLALPSIAHADAAGLRDIIFGVLSSVTPLWVPVAVLIVVITGLTMLLSAKEDGLSRGRNTVVAVAIGGVIILVGPVGLGYLYQAPGFFIVNTAEGINVEAIGVSAWLSSMAGMFGILLIVVSAVRAVASVGSDDAAYTTVRQSIKSAVLGLIVIAGTIALRNTIFSGDPNPLIGFILEKMSIVLALMTTAAMAVLVYAGVRMALNFGQEEFFTQARSLAVRVLMGLGVVLVSYALVFFVGATLG